MILLQTSLELHGVSVGCTQEAFLKAKEFALGQVRLVTPLVDWEELDTEIVLIRTVIRNSERKYEELHVFRILVQDRGIFRENP